MLALDSAQESVLQIDDNLTSNDISRALSANQGRVLKNLVDSKADASSVRNAAVQFKNITDIPSGVYIPAPNCNKCSVVIYL
jgi:hypothetical protein